MITVCLPLLLLVVLSLSLSLLLSLLLLVVVVRRKTLRRRGAVMSLVTVQGVLFSMRNLPGWLETRLAQMTLTYS